jgi:putative peptidoglycan lipid II flippase
LGAIQIADLFIIRLTSNLPEGSTAGYFYGYNLQQLPETLLGTAIAIVFFPTMAEFFNKGDIEGMKRTAMSALGIIWTLTIPAAFAVVLLGREGITLFFEQGEFDARSTALVYGILVFFSVRVVSEATLEIVARLFYAQHDTRTPMAAYVGWLVVNVTLMYLLVGSMGAAGLALASTVAFTLLSAVLFILNRRRLGSLYERELLVTAGRSLAGSLVMTGVILLVETWITSTLLYFLVAAVAGGLVYLATITLLGGREIAGLIRLLLPERASN